MARIRTPLLSLEATGKLANSLIYNHLRRYNTVKRYYTPTDPQSAAQLTQRANVAAAVSWWRGLPLAWNVRQSWALFATTHGKHTTAYSEYLRQNIALFAAVADAGLPNRIDPVFGGKVIWRVRDAWHLGQLPEAGDYDIWYGSKPTSIAYSHTKTIDAFDPIVSDSLGSAGDRVFVALRKDDYWRAGISDFILT